MRDFCHFHCGGMFSSSREFVQHETTGDRTAGGGQCGWGEGAEDGIVEKDPRRDVGTGKVIHT